jgi:hypothetical protein
MHEPHKHATYLVNMISERTASAKAPQGAHTPDRSSFPQLQRRDPVACLLRGHMRGTQCKISRCACFGHCIIRSNHFSAPDCQRAGLGVGETIDLCDYCEGHFGAQALHKHGAPMISPFHPPPPSVWPWLVLLLHRTEWSQAPLGCLYRTPQGPPSQNTVSAPPGRTFASVLDNSAASHVMGASE